MHKILYISKKNKLNKFGFMRMSKKMSILFFLSFLSYLTNSFYYNTKYNYYTSLDLIDWLITY
jgi:hypothetical protein